MTHVPIQKQLDGKAADWMEKVSDEQYQGLSQPECAWDVLPSSFDLTLLRGMCRNWLFSA